MITGGPHSWNIRYRHMADTLERLLTFHGGNRQGCSIMKREAGKTPKHIAGKNNQLLIMDDLMSNDMRCILSTSSAAETRFRRLILLVYNKN